MRVPPKNLRLVRDGMADRTRTVSEPRYPFSSAAIACNTAKPPGLQVKYSTKVEGKGVGKGGLTL